MTAKQRKIRVFFTGGGSGGHVIPALTLIEELRKNGDTEVRYIGSYDGIEANLVNPRGIKYYGVSSGKLRRYFSWKNFTDFFRVIKGFTQSAIIMLRSRFSRRCLVFSTGGFVSLPVVYAAKLMGIKVFIHEQTSRAGLANKLASLVADKVFISFEDSRKFFPASKTIFSGYPIRAEIRSKQARPLKLKGRSLDRQDRPILFVTGGGNGSKLINDLVRKNLTDLKNKYLVIHQVGKKFIESFLDEEDESYICLSFIGDEMVELLKRSHIVISRAGAGTVCELLALKKRSILIPLKIAQKNEQYWNAVEAVKKLNSLIIEEDEVKGLDLIKLIESFESEKTEILPFPNAGNATQFLIDQINNNN
jgi:UDP-N-acetylglucosamine--N-acetylmuramyl-(pentapeptide) pyrophosphoryl-undecaprenol N-acetylglucosamine transferase